MSRQRDLDTFYEIISDLRQRVGGYRLLRECTGQTGWPKRGVYFFFEDGEYREDMKSLRMVRVGTHAVSNGSRTTLWNRLHTHRGHHNGGGNHRGSIFRKRVGEALLAQQNYTEQVAKTWGKGDSAPKVVRAAEVILEQHVSDYIGQMPFLWVELDDAPSPNCQRAYLERNSIALLSNFEKPPIDPPSNCWLGLNSSQPSIRESGLWNTNHVAETYDPAFLGWFADVVRR